MRWFIVLSMFIVAVLAFPSTTHADGGSKKN
jgi:hypothetical protein